MKKILVFIAVLMMSYTINAQRIVSDVTEGNTRTVTCNYEPIADNISVSISGTAVGKDKINYNLNFQLITNLEKLKIGENLNEKLIVETGQGFTIDIYESNGINIESKDKKYKVNNKLKTIDRITVSFKIDDYIGQMLREDVRNITLYLEPQDGYKFVNLTTNFAGILQKMQNLIKEKISK